MFDLSKAFGSPIVTTMNTRTVATHSRSATLAGHGSSRRLIAARAASVEAPAKISATDRVKLGESDLEVSGEQQRTFGDRTFRKRRLSPQLGQQEGRRVSSVAHVAELGRVHVQS